MRPARRTFKDKQQLADALAEAVAANLKAGIAARGQASVAVSGGTTPAGFFRALAGRDDVAWDKVTVTLLDDLGSRLTDDGETLMSAPGIVVRAS